MQISPKFEKQKDIKLVIMYTGSKDMAFQNTRQRIKFFWISYKTEEGDHKTYSLFQILLICSKNQL